MTITNIIETPVNVADHRGRLLVTAPLAGCNGNHIRVVLEGNCLQIAGTPMGGENMSYLVHEWHPGAYSRSVELPAPVKGEGAFAHFGNGILIVYLDKSDEPQTGTHTIEVTRPTHEEVHPAERRPRGTMP